MTRDRTLLAIALAGSVLVAGCAPAGSADLVGREFVSVAVTDGGAPKALVPGTDIRLTFMATDLGASAGCNHIGGAYRIDGNRLVVDQLAMTEMGCDPDRHAQDAWLSEVLGARPTISLTGSDLTLEAGSLRVTLRDREVVEPDANLVGPTWTVESIISGDAVSSVPAERVATLVFREDGTLEVNAGCNRGSGPWSAVGGGIEVGPLLLTKMACGKEESSLEGAVLAVLEAGTVSAQVDSTLLTLQAGNRGLLLRAG